MKVGNDTHFEYWPGTMYCIVYIDKNICKYLVAYMYIQLSATVPAGQQGSVSKEKTGYQLPFWDILKFF